MLVASLVVGALTGCADVSGLTDFQLAEGGGGSVGGSGASSSAGGSSSSGGGGGTAPIEPGCPDDVELATGAFGSTRAMDELNSADDDDDPTFTADGLELYFNREVMATGTRSIWSSTRTSLDDPWDPPTVVPELSSTGDETNVVIAPDGLTLWLTCNLARHQPM